MKLNIHLIIECYLNFYLFTLSILFLLLSIPLNINYNLKTNNFLEQKKTTETYAGTWYIFSRWAFNIWWKIYGSGLVWRTNYLPHKTLLRSQSYFPLQWLPSIRLYKNLQGRNRLKRNLQRIDELNRVLFVVLNVTGEICGFILRKKQIQLSQRQVTLFTF